VRRLRRLLLKILELANDYSFTRFQNELVHNLYDFLGKGYNLDENEVDLVNKLVKATNGKTFKELSFYVTMLHGPRSYVNFYYLDRHVTKEIGDMAVISLVTYKDERLLQRICIIQNKKASGKNWGVDLEQLFLLKNFPPFSGNKGIFSGYKDLTFKNYSGCLGAFGFLAEPGEILFVAAPLVWDFLRGKKNLKMDDISMASDTRHSEGAIWGFPFLPLSFKFHPKDWIFFIEEVFERYGYPYGLLYGQAGQGYLGNTRFCRDLYEFTRVWTQLNIGEITCLRNIVLNPTADAFANFLIRSSGYRKFPHFLGDNIFGERKFEAQMAIFIMHLNLGEE